MKQYLTLSVSAETGSVEHFLRVKAGLTRRQISRAKFSENGILKMEYAAAAQRKYLPGILSLSVLRRKIPTLPTWSRLLQI